MNIPVLLEPIPTGFRATTGAPMNLAAEAPTADDALRAIEGMLATAQARGARIVEVPVASTDAAMERIRGIAARMSGDPCLDDVIAATKKYRREREAEEDAAEAAKPRTAQPNPAGSLQKEPAA